MADPFIDNVAFLANFAGNHLDTVYASEVGDPVAFYDDAVLQDDAITLFGNTTLYCDGAGDYVDTGNPGDFDFLHTNLEDFTIEIFVRFPTASISSTGYFFNSRGTSGNGLRLGIVAGGNLTLTIEGGELISFAQVPATMVANQFYYVTITRTGGAGGPGVYEAKIDAVSVRTVTSSPTTTATSGRVLTLGKLAEPGSTAGDIQCYIGPVRVTRGVARDITSVPTEIFDAPATKDAYFGNVTSLLNFAGMASGTTITDTAPVNPQSWFANGDAAVAGGVLTLDGNGDYLAAAPDSAFLDDFDGTNSNAWTIEMRYEVGSISSAQPLIDWRSAFASIGLALRQPTSPADDIRLSLGDDTGSFDITITTPSLGLTVGQVVEVAITRSGDEYYFHVNGVYIDTGTMSANLALGSTGPRIGRFNVDTNDWATANIYRVRFTRDYARYVAADYSVYPGDSYPEPPYFTTQPTAEQVQENTTASFTVAAINEDTLQWYETTAGELTGETAATLSFTATTADDGNSYYCVAENADGTLQSDTVALTVIENVDAYIAVATPLGQPAALLLNDFSAALIDQRHYYIMQLTGDPVVSVPISSWQATQQIDSASYAQCVVPAVDDYIDQILARVNVEEFVIYRVSEIGGDVVSSELARAPIANVSLSEGSTNYTCVLSGYADVISAPASPQTRTMTGIRAKFSTATGLSRVRCDVDWFLSPGDIALIDGDTLTASYINYFVPTTGDIYMDVGER